MGRCIQFCIDHISDFRSLVHDINIIPAETTYYGQSYDFGIPAQLQYDGSNDDLDWRIDFRYLNFVYIIKYLRSKVIKGCFF